jgi:hypothetical protein
LPCRRIAPFSAPVAYRRPPVRRVSSPSDRFHPDTSFDRAASTSSREVPSASSSPESGDSTAIDRASANVGETIAHSPIPEVANRSANARIAANVLPDPLPPL